MEMLLNYMIRLLPGLIIGFVFVKLLPNKLIEIRILSYIIIFILFRDLLTPFNYWEFGSTGFFWIRFSNDFVLLFTIAIMAFAAVLFLYYHETDLRLYVVWRTKSLPYITVMGLVGAMVVVFPLAIIYLFIPIAHRGGEVALPIIVPIFFITIFGNLFEEFLFRGYLQGYFERVMSKNRAIYLSGLAFCFGHIFLAINISDVGLPLLIFVLYEGIVAAFIKYRYGVIASTITHGIAIFILSSGVL
jgi:hypothetical protein